MKVRELVKKLHAAILNHNSVEEKKIWKRLLKKSLKHKNTHLVK